MLNLLLIQVLRKFALVLRCVALLDKCKLVLCCSCQESSPPRLRPPQLDLLSCICSPAHGGAHALSMDKGDRTRWCDLHILEWLYKQIGLANTHKVILCIQRWSSRFHQGSLQSCDLPVNCCLFFCIRTIPLIKSIVAHSSVIIEHRPR